MTADMQWWKSDQPHQALASYADHIDKRQGYRRGQLLHYLRLYGDRAMMGYAPATYARTNGSGGGPDVRLSLNIVRSCVDSATSMACENQPRVEWLTTEGDWSLQRKAKMRTKFGDGLFYQGKAMRHRRRAIKNAALMGSGFVKVVRRHAKVHYESVFPGNLLVDEQEGVNACPQNLVQQECFDREILKQLFPSKRKRIESESAPSLEFFGRDPTADQVLVREAWHLPSAPDAGDGMHVVCIASETLVKEKWKPMSFPFAHWRWSEEPLGYFGVGLGHQLSGIQYEINQLLLTIQENCYRGGNLKIFVERAANIIQAHLSNTLRVPIIEYSGAPPIIAPNDVVSPQLLQHLQYLVQQAYNVTGISEMHAQASTPASITSGRQAAIYANIHSKRFLTFAQTDEEAILDLASLSFDAAKQIRDEEGSFKIARAEKNWLEQIDIDDVLGDDDEFQPEAFSSSMLPRSPTGRMAMIEAWQQLGWVGPDQGKKLMGVKDFDAELALETAPIDVIDKRLELMLEKSEYHPPHPRMDLVLARERAMLAYQRAELQGAPEENLELVGNFIDAIDDIETKAAASAASPMPPAGGMPPGPLPPPGGMPPPIPPGPMMPGPPPGVLQ